jgi:hypothetical protein
VLERAEAAVSIGSGALAALGNIRIDGWVLLFTFVVSIGFSSLFGLIPVLRYVWSPVRMRFAA